MIDKDAKLDCEGEGHEDSILWLVSSIDVFYDRHSPNSAGTDAETPNEMLKRRLTGVEARWWVAVILFTAVWLIMLYLFGVIADEMARWPQARFTALVIYIVTLVYMSREFGARFRVLNDRSLHSHETTWAMLSGWLMIGIISVISEPMKSLASDFKRYDTMTSVALVSWIYLYNAALKLPWDKATEQRKAAHLSWYNRMTGLVRLVTRTTKRVFNNIYTSNDVTLHSSYHLQLLTWDSRYPNWRPAWQRINSAAAIARCGPGRVSGNTC